MNNAAISTTRDDSELVLQSVSGDQQAYAELVQRYQSLVCSVAFSHCGCLSVSEEVAQDAFLKAWQKLSELQTPSKFKGWVCTIARHLAQRAHKKETRSILGHAAHDDAIQDVANSEATPIEKAITQEEEQLIWKAIASIPEHYREPLVLYYREGMSVSEASLALELSEDALKQRLVRGRAMLQEHLVNQVAETLARTKPTSAFTASVMLVIGGKSSLSLSSAAAASQAMQLAGSSLAWPAIQLPLLAWLYRTAFGEMRSPREREVFRRGMLGIHLGLLLFAIVAASSLWWLPQLKNKWLQALTVPGLMVIFQIANVLWCRRMGKQITEIRRQEVSGEEPRPLVAAREHGSRLGIRMFWYFGLSAGLLALWGGLPYAVARDWSRLSMIMLAAGIFSLIFASLAITFQKLAFSWYVVSNTLITLSCLGLLFLRENDATPDVVFDSVYFGSLNLLMISLVVLNILAWKRVYGRRS